LPFKAIDSPKVLPRLLRDYTFKSTIRQITGIIG
jgi:hypothetical protein